MQRYGQFCPIAVACETLTERWTPLVVRELLCGSRHFNDLRRGLPLMSPSLLIKRLRTLEQAGIVERLTDPRKRGAEYRLTPAGEELRPIIDLLADWGYRWSRGLLDPANLDASLLMWDIRRNVLPDRAPAGRVVVHLHLSGSHDKRSRYWLVIEDGTADLCVTDPGFEVDLHVDGHVRAMVRYWLGMADLDQLVRTGDIRITGPRALARAFPTWFRRTTSPVAGGAEVSPAKR